MTDEKFSLRDVRHHIHMDNHRNRSPDVWTVYKNVSHFGKREIIQDDLSEADAEALVQEHRREEDDD